MTIVHLLTYSTAQPDGNAFREWLKADALPALTLLPGAHAIDLYVPAGRVSDPYLDDGAGPAATVMTSYTTVEAAQTALADPAFNQSFAEMDGCPVDADAAHDLMEMRFFKVPGQPSPDHFTARISYVVRYHRPADDEDEFVAHYLSHHPPILATFPNIRNVICYVPVPWTDPTGIPPAEYLLGNEVAFDSLDDLDAALNSPVRDTLREDFNGFPKFSGANTHYPMRRTRLSG